MNPRRRRAAAWLAFLAPFFYLTYGAANAVAMHRSGVPSIAFAWERRIPFVAWTIIPYWSINAFYAASFFVCRTRDELDTLGRRLLTAQVAAVACFLLFPLRCTFRQPQTGGLVGFLFSTLTGFDKPFNQAPSLHIALLVILWRLYANHLPRRMRWPLHVWFALVGVSVLTTYQHHVVDVPTGALLGAFCLWLWPDEGTNLAARYAAASAALAAIALASGAAAFLLLWPAASLACVAANYAIAGPDGFRKDGRGRMPVGARLLLAPYLAAAFVNSRWWSRRDASPVAIADGVWLWRMPSAREAARFRTVVDVCAELPGAAIDGTWTCVPMLDLVAPDPERLREAAAVIERARPDGAVLVCCAVGYSRSVAAIATWLVATGRAEEPSDALAHIHRSRPRIVVDVPLRAAIAAAAGGRSCA